MMKKTSPVWRWLAVAVLLGPAAAVAASNRTPAAAESDARRELRDAERLDAGQLAAQKTASEDVARIAAETMRLAHERAEAAARLRIAESATAAAAARIDDLAQRRRDAEQRLKTRAEAMQPLLPLIERLSLYPAETLLAVPASPEDALRGVLVLRGLSRQIEIEAEALRRDQAALDAATAALRDEAPRLAAAEAAQKREADALDDQIAAAHAARAAAETRANDAASQAAEAAARMDTLRAALNAIEAQRRADEASAREEASHAAKRKHRAEAADTEAAAARPARAGSIETGAGPRGQLQPPVIGVVIKGWGEQTDAGPATGVSYVAPPGARVISPCGGRVVFGQSFRSYGLLLIVDCGGGYHVVLSGFDRLDVRLGQSIVAGEPVGVMPAWEPGSAGRRPALYVELRHDGQPVNPAPWLKASS